MSRFYQTGPEQYDANAVKAICDAAQVSELTARALLRRGAETPDKALTFLQPLEQKLCDPYQLPDLPEAIVRICYALRHDELICVYGDYDADGICASAILIRSLELLGGRVIRYIPLRHGEGYGLNGEAVRKLAKAHVRLLITVDNGVSAHDEIALCHNLNIDVIVTDHHSIGATLPECCAVVSAKRTDSNYENRHLCGAGVALKIAQALLPEEDHRFELALAAVATVADVVPLLCENRAIVAQGLPYIADNIGLRALLTASGWKAGQPVDEQTVAFLLAPRLNASGRMGDAMRGVELLLSTDEACAAVLADSLDADNLARRAVESEISEQALARLDLSKRALIAADGDWNPGVTGIVASRFCETFHKPAILFSEHDGVLTGSGRCPESIDLYAELTKLSRYFVRYGGHARAAGITLLRESFAPFCEAFYAQMNALDESCFLPAYGYEEVVSLERLSVENVQELRRLAPFGYGNPEPVFLLADVGLQNVSAMGRDGAHLSATAMQDGAQMRLVAFRKGSFVAAFSAQERYDLIARPAINRFRDRVTAELYYVVHEPSAPTKKLFDAIFSRAVYNGAVVDDKIAEWYFSVYGVGAPFYEKDELRALYTFWQVALTKRPLSPRELLQTRPVQELLALLIFIRLGFFELDAARDLIRPCEKICFAPLERCALYCWLSKAEAESV